jgi:hypothetical protein
MVTSKFLSEFGKYAERLELAQPICVVQLRRGGYSGVDRVVQLDRVDVKHTL